MMTDMVKKFHHTILRFCTFGNGNNNRSHGMDMCEKHNNSSLSLSLKNTQNNDSFGPRHNFELKQDSVSVTEISSKATTPKATDPEPVVSEDLSTSAPQSATINIIESQVPLNGLCINQRETVCHLGNNNLQAALEEVHISGRRLTLNNGEFINSKSHSSHSVALLELEVAITNFNIRYNQFNLKQHSTHELNVDHFRFAFNAAQVERDISISSRIFENEITDIIRRMERKSGIKNTKWTATMAKFITKLYPLARFSLRLTSAIADVIST